MKEILEKIINTLSFKNWLHPILNLLTPISPTESHGLSLHDAYQVIQDNHLKVDGVPLKIGDAVIITTVKDSKPDHR